MKPKSLSRDVRITLDEEILGRLDRARAKTVQSRVQFITKAALDRIADVEASNSQ